MKMKTILRIAATVAVVFVLGACLLQGGDDSDTGALRIGLPTVSSAAISSGVDTVRIWLYTPSNLEFGVDGGSARLPGEADNFLEAAITESGGAVVIDGIPAADGYRLVIVLGTLDGDVFLPIDVAESAAFQITGGRETSLSLSAAVVTGLSTDLEGSALTSVVEVDVPAATIFTASSTTVYNGSFGSLAAAGSVGSGDFTGISTIYGVSPGSYADGAGSSDEAAYINTDGGIVVADESGASVDFATTMNAAGIEDVVDSGAFYLSGSGETVVYYQRLGGLGGAVFTDVTSPIADDWEDSGDELGDYVEEDESPVRAAATNGDSAAYIASVLGTFAVTEQYFEIEFDAGALIEGDDATGLTFWGVAYPGNDRPLRITDMGYLAGSDSLVVGTPRGAFVFPASAVSGAASNGGLIPAAQVDQVAVVADQPIVDISVNDGFIAFLTARSLVVTDTDLDVEFTKPLRAVALGAPRDAFVAAGPTVYIAGAEGLTQVVE